MICLLYFGQLFFRIRYVTSGWKQVASQTFRFDLNINDMAEALLNSVSVITNN